MISHNYVSRYSQEYRILDHSVYNICSFNRKYLKLTKTDIAQLYFQINSPDAPTS